MKGAEDTCTSTGPGIDLSAAWLPGVAHRDDRRLSEVCPQLRPEEALTQAMARYGTRVKKEAVNRALREVAGRHERDTDDLADWFQEVGKRLSEADPRTTAWRR